MDQNITEATLVEQVAVEQFQPWWLIRCGRGRVGGSTFLNFIIEWGRHRGRRVKPLDGDLRSRTLTLLYPPSLVTASLTRTPPCRRPARS